MVIAQQEAVEVSLDDEQTITKQRRPLSRNGLVWRRLRGMPRFWVGAIAFGLIVILSIVGPFVTPWSITDRDIYNMGMGPTLRHWFGTNSIGQDIFAQTMAGLQKSLIIGLVAGILGTLLAAVIGSVAGYVGGTTDKVISWFTHLLLVVPSFFILILLSPLFKSLSWVALTFFLAIFSWMIMAQVVRNQTRSLRNRDFVRAALHGVADAQDPEPPHPPEHRVAAHHRRDPRNRVDDHVGDIAQLLRIRRAEARRLARHPAR